MDLENKCKGAGDEHSRLMRVINFRFSHVYKKIGIISAVLIFALLIFSKFYGTNLIVFKDVCRTIMLLFLLLASLSKEPIEDEYVNHLRFQSYVIAFICATAYSIGIPLIAFVLDLLITKISGNGSVGFYEVSAFEVMFMLICFQLLFFETLKKIGRAE